MKKLYKMQYVSCVIPFFSSFVIYFITMFELKKHCALAKLWLCFYLTVFGALIVSFLVNELLMSGLYPILNFLESWVIFTISNLLCIELQRKAEKEIAAGKTKASAYVGAGTVFFVCVVAVVLIISLRI